MDTRRLDTGQLMSMGILNKPVPQTDVPQDREDMSASDSGTYQFIGAERVKAALREGKVVSATNYYGIPHLWAEGERFRGVLLQYRNVTEDPTFDDIDAAVEWFEGRYYETDG